MMKILSGQECKDMLGKVDFSSTTQEFIQSAFRVRIKLRDSGEYTLQIRHDFEATERDLNTVRREIEDKLSDWNFDQVIVEYKNCCCEGCVGCQRFTGEM